MAQNNIAITAMKQGLINENTLRFIRIGYPVLRVRANILSYKDSQDFCLIKKYIHRLVTGDQPTDPAPIAYVKDRLQAFQLLGLDKELYDVASYYYDELILDGKIHDSPQGALAGAAPDNDPTLRRIRSSRQVESCLMVDPFSADIYGQKVSELRYKTDRELASSWGDDICMPILPDYISHPETLEALINQQNFSFENCTEEFMTARLQAQNMPQGTRGIELVQDDDKPAISVYWRPYWLAYQRTEEGNKFFLYSCTSGALVDLFPINEPRYQVLQRFLLGMFDTPYYSSVNYALASTVDIPIHDKTQLAENVIRDDNGNYRVSLTDVQLAQICMAEETEVVNVLQLVTAGVGVIPTREAGRLISFTLTPQQIAFCESVLAAPEDRYALAFPILQEAAAQGNREAMYHTANYFYMGRGVAPDLEAAFALYKKASEAKHPWAILYQGICHLNGHGTAVDLDAAIDCWRKLPPNAPSYTAALHNIGIAYQKKDPKVAVEILTEAQSRKFITPFTSYALGYLYANGLGVEADPEEAAIQYAVAAGRGHIPAKYSLARCYISGTGVEKDLAKARQLLTDALQPCPEDRIFYLGAYPFIPRAHLVYTREELEKRPQLLDLIQSQAQKMLSRL